MIPQGYVQGLISRADRKGAAGIQELEELSETLFGFMSNNQGKQLVSSSINGKSFGFAVNMTNEEAFAAVEDALRQLRNDAGGSTPATYANFSWLRR